MLRRGEPMPTSDWGSKKARDLLKILLSRRGQRVPRDVIVELLWPDEDPIRTAPRLSVVLSTLRAALDPDKAYDDDHPLQADRAAVWLRLDGVEVDVERFLAEAARGLAAHRAGRADEAWDALTAAECGYTGDFLEEDAYEDWPRALREEARNAYVTVAYALVGVAGSLGDSDAATRYLYRVLARDPHDERAHLALISALEDVGRRGDARRAYRSYAQSMAELGVEPQDFFPQAQAYSGNSMYTVAFAPGLGSLEAANSKTFSMLNEDLVRIWDSKLIAGVTYTFVLDPADTTADGDLFLVGSTPGDPSTGVARRIDAIKVSAAQTWGGTETFTFTPTVTDRYGVVVISSGFGEYTLTRTT